MKQDEKQDLIDLATMAKADADAVCNTSRTLRTPEGVMLITLSRAASRLADVVLKLVDEVPDGPQRRMMGV